MLFRDGKKGWVKETSKFCEGQPPRLWKAPIFFMDIDDVLDKNMFGFPSTTADGIRAISLLRRHGAGSNFLHGDGGGKCRECKHVMNKLEGKRDLFWRLLKIADMPGMARWLRAFDWKIFEIFSE